MGERTWMISIREKQQLMLSAMALKCECSEPLLWILESDESSVTHPRIALKVAAAYGIQDPYILMNPMWRGKPIPPRPEPDERLMTGLERLGIPPKPAKQAKAPPRPIYRGGNRAEDRERVDVNPPAIAMLLLSRKLAAQSVSRDMLCRSPDWLRKVMTEGRKVCYGDAKSIAEGLKVPVQVILADCPEAEMRRYLPDSYFEATPATRAALCSTAVNALRKVNARAIARRLEEMNASTYSELIALAEREGLPRRALYDGVRTEAMSLAHAMPLIRITGLAPEEFFEREEDARVFSCASGALSASTGRGGEIRERPAK